MTPTTELAEKLEDIAGYRDIILQHRKITDDRKISYVLKDGTRIHEDESVVAKLAASLTASLEHAAETAIEAAALLRKQAEELERCRTALRPFAEELGRFGIGNSSQHVELRLSGRRAIENLDLSVADFERARSAYNEPKQNGEAK